MDAITFFNSDELELPKTRDLNSFDVYLSKIFDDYLSTLAQVDNTDYLSSQLKSNYNIAQKLCELVKEVIRLQFNGSPAKAFDKLKEAIELVNPHFNTLLSSPDISNSISYLYKMRTAGSNSLSRNQIFHIPFELRHLVQTQRYSIPGLPCIYLGGSTYLCWEELNRPPLDSVHVSRFKPVDGITVKVLDFGYRPAEIAAYIDYEKSNINVNNQKSRFIIAQGLCWPLIAACSILVKFREAPFKPEYVIPQLLLQWITEATNCDGVRFFSTKINQYVGVPMPICNFAFPARSVSANGFCNKLASMFELTEPLYWQLAKGSTLPSSSFPNAHFKLKLADGAEVDYLNTEFGLMQSSLSLLPCQKI